MVAILCVPNSTKAAEMSEKFKSYLNKDGKYEFNSVVPANDDHFDLLAILDSYDEEGHHTGISFSNIAEDYSEFDLTINEETHRVKAYYNYDKDIEAAVKVFVNNVIRNKTVFEVKDLELVNYQYNLIKNENKAKLVMFSGELKEALGYGNLEFELSSRAGSPAPLQKETISFGYFIYDGSIYHVIDQFGAKADHIIYVPTNTENTKEALVEAVQKRIDDYLGETDIEVSYLSTAYEYWINYHYEDTRDQWETLDPNLTLEQFEQMGNVFIPTYTSFEEGFETIFGLSGISENDMMASINVPIDEDRGDAFEVIIKRDSSKMVNPVSKTADLSTNIEISSDSTLPLDTIIQAKKLTSGTEYERIMEILNLTDNVTFDLKLYSASSERYITRLDDGSFQVKIPIPENFEGKDLVVYYVKENGEKEAYTVDTTSEPGFAIFTTTHFSIYTLGYTEDVENPKTFDGIGTSIFMGTISLIGLVGTTIYLKKRNKVRA